eukprot:365570-Pleurochrysis_carterae.AAC.1
MSNKCTAQSGAANGLHGQSQRMRRPRLAAGVCQHVAGGRDVWGPHAQPGEGDDGAGAEQE